MWYLLLHVQVLRLVRLPPHFLVVMLRLLSRVRSYLTPERTRGKLRLMTLLITLLFLLLLPLLGGLLLMHLVQGVRNTVLYLLKDKPTRSPRVMNRPFNM